MSSPNPLAKKLVGDSFTRNKVEYNKIRVSGSNNVSYFLHSKGGCMPGQNKLFTATANSKPSLTLPVKENSITNAFKRERYLESKPLIGDEYNKGSVDNYSYASFEPYDDETLKIAIRAAYKQVYGNYIPFESEELPEAKRRLRNGDISIREFIRQLSKSDFYRINYFEKVSAKQCVSLSYKHILGRPPINTKELIKGVEMIITNGFNEFIDSLVDSVEYEKTFGSSTVPYQRCWNSPCGVKTKSFIDALELEKTFLNSDNAK